MIVIYLFLFAINVTRCTVYYVNPDNSVLTGGGRTWNNAFTSFDLALLRATKLSDEIWLKGGYIYKPSTTDRSNCFVTSIGLTIYGGFVGNELNIDERPRITSFESIISGDINLVNDKSDNCYHVITYNKILKLDGVTIINGYANGNNDGNGNVMNNYGGALITVSSTQKSELDLIDVKFINNTAINGGALWFESTDANLVKIMITNCIFQNNIAIDASYEGGYGGAIYSYFLANITIQNTQFIENRADFRGGAIYQDYGAWITCIDCNFTSNSAAYGGGIFSEDRNSQTSGTFPLIRGSIFNRNTASIYGGGICWFNGVIGTLQNNQFNMNEVSDNGKGGGIAIITSEIIGDVMSNNIFNGNIANNDITTKDIYNESVFIFNGIDSNIEIEQNSILNDVITYIDDIYNTYNTLSSTKTDLYPYSTFNDLCYIDIDNTNSPQSGTSWNSAYNDIQTCIDKLSAYPNGGEIWVKKGVYNPTTVPLWKEKIGKTSQGHKSFIMATNIRIYGGFDGTETLREERNFKLNPTYLSCNLGSGPYCTQIVQAADNSLIDGFIFIEAQYIDHRRRRLANSISVGEVLSSTSGNNGAGIYSNSTTINVVNSVFYALFSNGKGAAVYCIGQEGEDINNIKSPTFINVAFIKNRANVRGGAITADVSCHFKCEYCTFDGNECAKKGGAIYLDFGSDPTISYSTFSNNYAAESGGCLAADGRSNATFIDTQFTNNYAKWEGGCLYSGSGVSSTIVQGFTFYGDNTFNGNYLINSGSGQNDIYGWPFSTIEFKGDYNASSQQTSSPLELFNISAPNFLIFFIDDLPYIKDWTDYAPGIELQGKQVTYIDVPLPNIAQFMSESVVFPRSYAGGPKCSPSRFSLLTGRYATKNKFAIYQTLRTSSGWNGINVTVPTSKLLLEDGIYNIPYQLQNDLNNPYYTGMVGKWHLLSLDDNDYKYGCDDLNTYPDKTLYDQCTNIVKTQGFSVVDAFYEGNLNSEPIYFSHNPEWMVDVSIKFMDDAALRDQPFFLYFANTLSHEPFADNSLFKFNITNTPKGILEGIDIPKNIPMASRTDIWNTALNLGFSAHRMDTAALYVWMDATFGALITYLKDKNIYDETFIVIMNDHGMNAKGTLYEQGSRIMQIVRFPPLFGTNGHIMDNFVTSNVDLASVIFELSGITLDDKYELDGTNWIMDVFNTINNGETTSSISDPECCKYRHIDVYNSHSIVSKEWKYIYRATDEVEPDHDPTSFYKFSADTQQLYNLISDPNEQINQIDNDSLSIIIATMQKKMVEYIENDMCKPLSISCKTPEITFTLPPTSEPTMEMSSTIATSEESNKNSGGAIAAIVIVIFFGLLFVIMIVAYWYKNIYIANKESNYEKKDGKMVQLTPKAAKKVKFSPHTNANSVDIQSEFPDTMNQTKK